mmetsp:Transcript_503/g.683  ORF Transcript_503/g.683 Transcript_503/m.683 type:complete len:82 (-) Transcript_503:51-296(-)
MCHPLGIAYMAKMKYYLFNSVGLLQLDDAKEQLDFDYDFLVADARGVHSFFSHQVTCCARNQYPTPHADITQSISKSPKKS